MADALISPSVAGAGWILALAGLGHAARRVQRAPEAGRPALMGVLGAFVFAAQMINFSIPGTGSSGHLGGGLLLSVLLGPHAAFLVMASVLTVQALLFADGGLLALGCNIVNLGALTCFVAYPLLFLPLAGPGPTRVRLTLGALVAALVGLELGAFAVVLETTASGLSRLPFASFALFMLPIHAAIGVVEGLVTAGVVLYVWRARPDLVRVRHSAQRTERPLRTVLVGFAIAALLAGGVLSWFASTRPDGLEWSASHASGSEQLPAPAGRLHRLTARAQSVTSRLPDYSLGPEPHATDANASHWPAPNAGTSASGLIGAGLTLLVALGVGLGLRVARFGGKPGPPSPGP
ncbi:MAG: energy-coupling factor ABC transporter permease [Polyangiaceae bacterium]|nr:energy-coupling factor ABC transporter permease [Polyangiaceae bacterium]